MLDIIDKNQDFQENENEINSSNNLNLINNNINNINKVFVIKSVDIYNSSNNKNSNSNNDSSGSNSPEYGNNYHPHDKIRKSDYIEISKEDEDEITTILENTPDLSKDIAIIKTNNHQDNQHNSIDNSLIINNLLNSSTNLIFNNVNNNSSNNNSNLTSPKIKKEKINDGATSLNYNNFDNNENNYLNKSLLFNNVNNNNNYYYYQDNEDDMDNIKNLKDCNNIEMDYIDLDVSNNILRKSLRNLSIDPNARKKTNKFKQIFSINFFKTIVLVFMISNLGYGTYFSYTSAEALSSTFYNKFLISSKEFGSLFTLYAIPNIVMVFISGVIIDIIGPDKVSIVLSSIVVLSTLIGVFSPPNYSVMLFSRFLLGFAGESLIACSNTLMSKWFSSKTLSLSMGVLVGWIYSANFISLTVLPAINKSYGFQVCLWVIFFVAVLGLLLNCCYLIFKNKFKDISNKYEDGQQLLSMDYLDRQQQQQSQHQQYNEDTGIILITDLNNDLDSLSNINSNYKSIHQIKINLINSLKKIKFIFKEIPSRMWITVGIVFFGYTALFGFAIIGPDFLNQKYGFNEQKAALILSSEHICSALFSPICGILIKKVSKRILILFIALVLLATGLALMLFTNVYPLPWIIVCGIGYSMLNTTIYSSLPIFVPESVIGTSYGLVGTSYNLGLVVFPIILGSLKESTGNYYWSISILILNSLIAIILLGLLKYKDNKSIINQKLDK